MGTFVDNIRRRLRRSSGWAANGQSVCFMSGICLEGDFERQIDGLSCLGFNWNQCLSFPVALWITHYELYLDNPATIQWGDRERDSKFGISGRLKCSITMRLLGDMS